MNNRLICTLIVSLIWSLILLGCRDIDVKELNANDKKRLADDIWLHQTSGVDYIITDSDGMGLVFGNILRISYSNQGSKSIIALYEDSRSSERALVEINLQTKKVSKIDELSESEMNRLEEVSVFFNR